MKLNSKYIVLIVLGFLSASCKKNHIIASNLSKTELISRKWFYSKIYFDVDDKKSEVYGTLRSNKLKFKLKVTPKDYLTFRKDGTLEVYNKSDNSKDYGKWKFVNDENRIELNYSKKYLIYSIEQLTSKKITLTITTLMETWKTAPQHEQSIILIGGFLGLVEKNNVKIKFEMQLITK